MEDGGAGGDEGEAGDTIEETTGDTTGEMTGGTTEETTGGTSGEVIGGTSGETMAIATDMNHQDMVATEPPHQPPIDRLTGTKRQIERVNI